MAPPAKRRKHFAEDSFHDDLDEPTSNANSIKKYLVPPPRARPVPKPATAPKPKPAPLPFPFPPKRFNPRANRPQPAASSPLAAQNRPATPSLDTTSEKEGTQTPAQTPVQTPVQTQAQTQAQTPAQTQSASSAKGNGVNPHPSLLFKGIAFEDYDPISDDEDEVELHKAAMSSIVKNYAVKMYKENAQRAPAAAAKAPVPRFKPPPLPSWNTLPSRDDETRPWSERFGPTNLDELAVHKRKVADVRRWLEDVASGRLRQRLLVLKGAAGTGKTTTVRLLAKSLACDVVEWRNPAASMGGGEPGFRSMSAQFEEFLGRGDQFGQLQLESREPRSAVPAHMSREMGSSSGNRRRLILIEEFPNTFVRASSAHTSFRNAILAFLAASSTPQPSQPVRNMGPPPPPPGSSAPASTTPIVMVVSETLLTTTSASADSFTAHRLLGPEILTHPATGVIEFNTIAPTLLYKALELVVLKEARKSGRRHTPAAHVLKRIGEIGDIRSAISSLEFLCVKGGNDANWSQRVAYAKLKRTLARPANMTQSERDSLDLISQREASLGLFHAVGKVVYNKRESDAGAARDWLPPHLAHCARPKRSLVAVDTLMDETGTDAHTFLSAVHENFVLSCEPTSPADPMSGMDYLGNCLDHLSDADMLCPSRDAFSEGRGHYDYYDRNQGCHVLRQDEMGFQVAVRGLLHALPHPVKRQPRPPGTETMVEKRSFAPPSHHNNAYKMFYPRGLQLWRAKEEIDGLVALSATKLLNREGPSRIPMPVLPPPPPPPPFSALGQQRRAAAVQAFMHPELVPKPEPPQGPHPLCLGDASRRDMLLDRLPYMAHFARRRNRSMGGMTLRDLERVVSFRGVGRPVEEISDDDEEEAETWATDKPSDEPARKKGRGRIQRKKPEAAMQKLFLSDDDIEDDNMT